MAQAGRERTYTAEKAINNVIAFVEAEDDSVEDDLEELYGADNDNEFCLEEDESGHDVIIKKMWLRVSSLDECTRRKAYN